MKLHVVHFSSNSDLPESVRSKIPHDEAQTIFRTALNEHLDKGKSEMHAYLGAWKTLRDSGLSDDEGNPVTKDLTVGDVHVNKPLGAIRYRQGKKKTPLNIPGNTTSIEDLLDKRDTVTLDIPLFIRLLEVAREEIKSDEPLHVIAERVADLAEKKPELDMEDFSTIIEELKKGGPGSGGAREGAGRKPGGNRHSVITPDRKHVGVYTDKEDSHDDYFLSRGINDRRGYVETSDGNVRYYNGASGRNIQEGLESASHFAQGGKVMVDKKDPVTYETTKSWEIKVSDLKDYGYDFLQVPKTIVFSKMDKDDPGTEDVDVEEPVEAEKPPVEDPVDKGGPGSGGAREGAGRKPGGKNLSEKAQRAIAAYKPCNATEQRRADKSEATISRALGVPRTKNNSAFDLKNDDVGIEIKTMLSGKNDKVTMSKAALGRKVAESSAEGIKTFTVVADLRGRSTARYYVSEKLGSLRLGSMRSVTLPELRDMVRGAI